MRRRKVELTKLSINLDQLIDLEKYVAELKKHLGTKALELALEIAFQTRPKHWLLRTTKNKLNIVMIQTIIRKLCLLILSFLGMSMGSKQACLIGCVDI
jgi:hypothetical protein